MELETGFLFEAFGLLNGVAVVRLLLVELEAAFEVADELGLLESSPCELDSTELELRLSDVLVWFEPD